MKTKPVAWAALVLVAVVVSGASVVAIDRADRAAHAWSAHVRTHLAEVGVNAVVTTIVSKLAGCARL